MSESNKHFRDQVHNLTGCELDLIPMGQHVDLSTGKVVCQRGNTFVVMVAPPETFHSVDDDGGVDKHTECDPDDFRVVHV